MTRNGLMEGHGAPGLGSLEVVAFKLEAKRKGVTQRNSNKRINQA